MKSAAQAQLHPPGNLATGAALVSRPLPSLQAAMAAQFAAGGAIIPFVTLLFRDRGLDFPHISYIYTASSATLLVFPFLWGMLADRFVPLNRLLAWLNLLAFGALVVVRTQTEFLGLLLGYTCYFACFNPTLYLLNALSFHHLPNPREQFWLLRAWGSLGWIVPFLPISLWLAWGKTADLNFVLSLGMALCLVMATLSFWLPHTPSAGRAKLHNPRPAATGQDFLAKPKASRELSGYGCALQALISNSNYLVLLASMFLMAGSFSLLTYYSPPLLEQCGVPRPWIGPVQAIGVVFEIVLFQSQARLVRRWNYSTVILAGCVALMLRQLMFGLASNAWLLAASYLLAGAVIVFYNQGVSLLANALATQEVRATAQTLLLFLGQGMGPLCANAVAGRLSAAAGGSLRPIFFLGAALSGAAALVIASRGRRLNPPAEPQTQAQ